MNRAQEHPAIGISQSDELLKRIRKLRWIGLEEEARRLQLTMYGGSRKEVGSVPLETFTTD